MARHTSLKNVDISDRSLLGILVDSAQPDGYADVETVAKKLDIKHENPIQCVRMRLSWLARFGMVERSEEDSRWTLTANGRALFDGKLRTASQRAIRTMDAGEVWAATVEITQKYDGLGDETAHMIRRQFNHVQERRRLRSQSQ